jgi:hypothetical protein
MPNVLTMQGTVSCGHSPGTVQAQSTAKLSVGGAQVLVKDDINGKPVASCGIKPKSDNTGPIDAPCSTVKSVTAGEATKLTAGGNPVVLDTSLKGTTDGMVAKATPQGFLGGTAVQTKLRSV